jgi:hypothetical protein
LKISRLESESVLHEESDILWKMKHDKLVEK